MALKVQYNKTFMQTMKKALAVRENALPTLQAKESALRLEVKKARQAAETVEQQLQQKLRDLAATHRLWTEFPHDLIEVRNVDVDIHKIAGVKAPELKSVEFEVNEHSTFNMPAWIPEGIERIKEVVELGIRKDIAMRKIDELEYARKKTTQKVNLYEKVQIPAYREAILKIKRFLEDVENLAKSSQKILKTRLAASGEAA
ncbi:MAG: V-type ATP synthase subunit D [Chitinivibrionales bacterium]|nr:V-type ATP synthase subunit D [Chitinivibrionales bacterium]